MFFKFKRVCERMINKITQRICHFYDKMKVEQDS